MTTYKTFTVPQPGHFYMCEGLTETQYIYKHGFELPHFALLPLLEDVDDVSVTREICPNYLEVTAKYTMSALIGGLTIYLINSVKPIEYKLALNAGDSLGGVINV